MQKIILLFVFSTVILLFSNCKTLYTPTTPNISLIQNKKELQIESTIFTNGLNFKSAYSPIDKLSFQINGQSSFISRNSSHYHQYLDFAIGTYKSKKKSMWELYLGYGLGASDYGDPFYGGDGALTLAKGSYFKQFIQYNWGIPIIKSKGIFGGTFRLCNIGYKYDYANISGLSGNRKNNLSIEPYIFLRTNANRKFSFVTYLGITIISGNLYSIRTNMINMGVGLNLKIGRINNI